MEAVLDSTAKPTLAPLVAAARSGDRDAFGRLVEPHLSDAVGAARIVTGTTADAADAVQEALLSAWQGIEDLRDPEAFPSWFRRQVVRAALRIAKRRRRLVELDIEDLGPDGQLDRAVEQRTLARAFERLDARDRLLLTLHHYWGLPVAETAAHLGVPEGTVKSRVHHALKRLRAAYDAEDRR
ncbi:MAG: sigma-70 family RNA polymerase sigma factor [Chloroflexota bacterium]